MEGCGPKLKLPQAPCRVGFPRRSQPRPGVSVSIDLSERLENEVAEFVAIGREVAFDQRIERRDLVLYHYAHRPAIVRTRAREALRRRQKQSKRSNCVDKSH